LLLTLDMLEGQQHSYPFTAPLSQLSFALAMPEMIQAFYQLLYLICTNKWIDYTK